MYMEVGLSLGSNLGDRFLQLQKAKEKIIALKRLSFTAQSPVYETEPVGVSKSDKGLSFLNAVLIIESNLELTALARELKNIERRLGRIAAQRPNAARKIDIDVIYAGNMQINEEGIIVPHPRWSGRRFVVQPLSDVRPELIVPGQDVTVSEILHALSDRHWVKLFAKEW